LAFSHRGRGCAASSAGAQGPLAIHIHGDNAMAADSGKITPEDAFDVPAR
jgi:hypothetical protein